jgi:5-methylcytosine-specific restriction endonuclease McrA
MSKKTPIQLARNRADKFVTPVTRALYGDVCCVCGKPKVTGHHYYPKSSHGHLRYNTDNFVPLCYYCHMFKVHSMADPDTLETIRKWMGTKINKLKKIPRPQGTYMTLKWYEDNIYELKDSL